MKIHLIKSGGFLGIKEEIKIDKKNMSENEIKEFETLIEETHFFNMPNINEDKQIDKHEYQLTIEHKGKKHTVNIKDKNQNTKLAALINKINLKKTV